MSRQPELCSAPEVDKMPDKKLIKKLKAGYPKGTRLVVDQMVDDPNPIPAGTKGTVVRVDDIGTIHCDFDNGRFLGLIFGVDVFHVIEKPCASI